MKAFSIVCGLLMTIITFSCKVMNDRTPLVYKKYNLLSHYHDNNSMTFHVGNDSLLHHKGRNHEQHFKGNHSLPHYYGKNSTGNMTKGNHTAINFRPPLLSRRLYLKGPGSRKTKGPQENMQDVGSISRFRISGPVHASPTTFSAGNKWRTDSIENIPDMESLHKEDSHGLDISDDNRESKTWAQSEDVRSSAAASAENTTDSIGNKIGTKSFHKGDPQDQDMLDGNEASKAREQSGKDLKSTAAAFAEDTTDDNFESRWSTENGNNKETIFDISRESEASPLGLESNTIEDRVALDRNWNIPPIDYYKCGRCVCNASENGFTLQANCANRNLQKYPNNLSRNTTYLNLQSNVLQLEYNKLLYFTSLMMLDISFNHIRAVKNSTCNESLPIHTVDMSNNAIRTIDDNSFSCLPHLTHLYLQNNNIESLTNFMLGGTSRLKHLDVSHNLLRAIEPSSLNSARQLRVLKLSNNKFMSYSANIISSRLFHPLKQLEVLHIQGFRPYESKFPTAALLELTNLKELNIDGVVNGTFEQNLTVLKNLSIVKIGVDGHCNIHNLYADYFLGLPYLKLVHISGCEPKNISTLAFKANKLLEELRYTGIIYEFDSLFESLSGLQNSSIKSLTISYVRRYQGKTACRFLGANHSKYMRDMPHLRELNLENNIISLIQYGFLANLPATLEKLSLRKNTMHRLRSLIAHKGASLINNLVEIREDMQNRDIFLTDYEGQDDSSETVSCKVEAVNVLPAAPTHLSRTKIAENSTSSSLEYILPKNLEFYSAAQSFQFGQSVLSRSTKENKIRYFNISNVYMTDWGNKLLPPLVEVADFSDNYCDYIKPSFFRANNSLKELHIAGNFLGEIFAKDEKGDILSRLHHALFVDLSRNHIQYLPSQFFTGLLKVKVLDLSGNNLRILNVSMSHMKSLRFINLNQNSISWISRQTRNDLDLVNLHQQVSIDLTSNRLPCTCNGIEVLQWLATTNVRILNKDFLKCENEQNQVMPVGNLNERLISLHQKCVSQTVLILISSFSVIIFLLAALSTWMFTNRWRLCYLRNIAITKLFGLKSGNETENQQYRFDAYILYSTEDINFAMGECMKELEDKRGHKLCLEHRDFSLGSYMPCTITSAISCSRMTVPLISPDFWDSEWCEYGVQIAVMEAIHTKRDVLHLMIYKPVCAEQMPNNLIKVLKDNSFCEYPPLCCDEDVRTAFWDALSRSIGHAKIQDDVDGQLQFDSL